MKGQAPWLEWKDKLFLKLQILLTQDEHLPREYMLTMDLHISENLIPDVEAQGFHFLVGRSHGERIDQTAFIVARNKLVSLGQVPSGSLFCSSLVIIHNH